MKINEIFYSIQGEGYWTGLPNIFIRLTGCNLRCRYCDTTYAYKDGEEMSISQIIEVIKKYPCEYVCVTGGEPLINDQTNELIKSLFENDYQLIVETNGSINIGKIISFKKLIISLDIKCPSSGMHDKMDFRNISQIRKNDQIKFVISDRYDYEYAKNILKRYNPKCRIFFQPVWNSDYKKLAKWIIEDGIIVKFGLQIHKIIWNDKRGF